jgi:hypothetical protein
VSVIEYKQMKKISSQTLNKIVSSRNKISLNLGLIWANKWAKLEKSQI